ncbi:MAG: hypothetical protein HYV27_11655 [Candidatus Hydrogenedentes bacterium]|nr:hypothetical protein [Candidatus Hydrogenedentota bacterium]
MLGSVLALLLVLAIDFACGFIYQRKPPVFAEKSVSGRPVSLPDGNLGFHLVPNASELVNRTAGAQTIYSVTYTTDACGRRVVPAAAHGGQSQFLIFFGCSFTFGAGLGDNDTLPNQVAALAPDYHVYNYACGGYGPAQMLAILESGVLPKEIQEPAGIAVYVLRPGHVARVVGSMRTTASWARHFPYYAIEDDGALSRRGNFDEDRRFTNWYYNLAGKSGILNLLSLDLPLWYRESHYALTARVLIESRDLFLKSFKDGKFYVVFYPAWDDYRLVYTRILPYLEKAGVTVLNYNQLLEPEHDAYFLHPVYDRHPSAVAHKQVAAQLAQDLDVIPPQQSESNGSVTPDSP